MFLIYFISYGCNDSALVFLGGAEASASPSFALPMFITIKKIIILHLFLGVPAATVGGTGTPWHTRGYAPDIYMKSSFPKRYKSILIVFMKMNFFLPRPIHFVNIQLIMLKWSVGSVWTC